MSEKDTAVRCSWDGDISTFPDYVRRVRLVFEKTRRRRRKHLGPELVAQLTGKAWVITQEVDHARLTQKDGAKYLIEFLEMKLGRIPVPDAGARAEELLVKLRRPTGMSMSSWCSTVRESYRRLQRALKRARPESQAVTSPGKEDDATSMVPSPSTLRRGAQSPVSPTPGSPLSSPSRTTRRASKQSVPEPEQMPTPERPGPSTAAAADEPSGDDDAEEEFHEDPITGETSFQRGLHKGLGKGDPFPKSRSGKRKAADGSSSSSGESASWGLKMWADMDAGLPEVLPTELIGWLMLRRCNLSPQQRLNILSSTGNSLRADDIEQALRGAEEELRVHEAGQGKNKGKGGYIRPNFWIEHGGEWGLLAAEDGEALESSLEDVHWIGKDIAGVYATSSSMTSSPSVPVPAEPRWTSAEDGYWFQDDWGQFSFWSMHTDGEYYTQDDDGIFWSWDDFQQEAAWWNASPEQQKEIQDAFAAYDQKVRSFVESRELLRNKGASRGFYKGKTFGKGKGKGMRKGKSKSSAAVGAASPAVLQSQPSDVLASVGQPGYTGCFVCGSKSHDFRSCPQRGGAAGRGKGTSPKGGIYMMESADLPVAPSSSARPSSIMDDAWMAQVANPDLRGHAVLDTGATETVTSLTALEAIVKRRTELLGYTDHVEVVPGPGKVFRFGNGQTQQSESFVYLKQQVGNHEIKLGAYTIDASGVPLLLGIKTLERLGAILDTKQGFLVMKMVDPTLVVPLKRSPTGHLLLDLCSNWLDGGAKILFQTEISPTSVEEKAFTVVSFDGEWKDVLEKNEVFEKNAVFENNAVLEEIEVVENKEVFEGSEVKDFQSFQLSSSSPTAPHSCTNFDILVHTSTYINRAEFEDVFVVFDDSNLIQVQEEAVQFQNMTMSTATSHISSSSISSGARTSMNVPPQSSADQDQAMSLRILALLASTSLLAVYGAADGQVRCDPKGDIKACCKDQAQQGELGVEVRRIQNDGTGCSRSSLPRSTMLWESRDSQARPWLSDGQQRPWILGGMRTSPLLHSSSRGPCTSPQSRTSAGGHLDHDHQARPEQCRIQRQHEGQEHRFGCCGGVCGEEIGVSQGAKSSMAEQAEGGGQNRKFEGTDNHTNSSGLRAGRDVHDTREEIQEAGDTGRGVGVRWKINSFLERSGSELNAPDRESMNKLNYETKVDPKFPVLNYDMANYDFDVDVEDAWTRNEDFGQMEPDDKKLLSDALHYHYEELEECFGSLIVPGDGLHRQLDLMELCCEKDSLLSTYMEKSGGTAFRAGLHNGFDLMTEHGTQLAIAAVKKLKPKLLWVSFPCGPTSPVQALNELTEEGRRKSRERIRRSRKLVRNGIRVMEAQVLEDGQIVQEWPRYNRAWKFPEVIDFWQALGVRASWEDVMLDGCCYGLQVPEGFLKKPWCLRCSKAGAFSSLARQCAGHHKHVPTMGGNRTKHSAFYTPRLCQAVCHAYLQDQRAGFAFGAMEVDREGLKSMTDQELQHLAQSVLKLHRLCGHPSNRALMKTLAARGADGRTLAVAEKLNCMECLEGQMTKPSTKVALEKEETIWRTLQMDTFYFKYGDQVHHFLLMLDEASGFAVVKQFSVHHEEDHQNITTAETLQILQQSWFQYFGMPHRIRCDLEGAFRGDLLEIFCKERGIELTLCPAEHHESIGEVERNVGELKKKMTAYLRNEADSSPSEAAAEMCGAHNRIARVGGYAPNQWAFGRDVDERDNLALASSQADPASEMHQSLQRRLRAEGRYRELQAQAKISRALNAKVQKSTQFIPGDLIYYKRFKTPADTPAHALLDTPSMKVSRWFGPGRVLASETRVLDEGATRAPSNVVWIISQGRLKKTHSSQLRHASERERLIAEATEAPTLPWTFTSLGRTLQKGEYEDLTKEPPRRGRPPGSFNRPKTTIFKPKREPTSAVSRPAALPEPVQPEMADSDEELIPADDGLQPEVAQGSAEVPRSEELHEDEMPPPDLDVDKLLEDPKYFPMRMIDDEELKRRRMEFTAQRRSHELADRPFHVMQQLGEPGPAPASNFWVVDDSENDVFGVIIDMPKDENEWKKVLKNPAKFAAKSVSKGAEVAWNKLNPTQRAAMAEAKQLEVSQWVQQKVCERFKGVIPQSRLMRTRWVLVFKAVDDDVSKVKCKARIVLLGYTDPDLGNLETAAPTLSRRSRQLCLSMSTLRRWKTFKADAKSAFLQGRQTQKHRDIFITPVAELAQALDIPPGKGARMLKAAYGLVSAPREWFGEVDEVAANKCTMKRLKTDPCIWIKRDAKTGRTIGYVASHVDDFLVAGEWDNPEWIKTVEIFKQSFVWSPWEEQSYTHCGVGLVQNADFSFTFNHNDYVEQINQISINDKVDNITAEEMTQARAVLGAIQWRAIQSGPQHSAKLSCLQSALPRGSKDVLHQINKLCRECHAQRFQSIAIKNLGIHRDEDVAFACWTDAAVGNRPDMSSTGGYMIALSFREARFEKLEIEKLHFGAGSFVLELLALTL
eukprot:s2772_g6.t1